MKGIVRRLIAAVIALVLAVIMMVTISYAWITISSAPMVGGVNISIGGGTTILVAPNKTATVNGVTYNYPGAFSETIDFSSLSEYSYLNDLSGLMPVSTADGIHWFLPEYYDVFDEAVINGEASVGQVKPIENFYRDIYLEYANLPESEKVKATSGNYIYLDFWVVSPGDEYELRVSRGDDNGGSFMIELMSAKADGESYVLTQGSGSVAASVRIGFLVNTDNVPSSVVDYYKSIPGASTKYSSLRGIYQEKDQDYWFSSDNRFTIYEPNGDLHPSGTNGDYYITSPVAWNGQLAYYANIKDKLTIQKTNDWKSNVDPSANVPLGEIFETAISNRNFDTAEEAERYFYESYLQSNLMYYVNKGSFVKNTGELYDYAEGKGKDFISANDMIGIDTAGATDDSYIVRLEKNVPQRIRMFVWIEGQDADCTNQMSELNFSINIELAGSNQNVYEKSKQED